MKVTKEIADKAFDSLCAKADAFDRIVSILNKVELNDAQKVVSALFIAEHPKVRTKCG